MVTFSRRCGWDQYGWMLDMAELGDEEFEKSAEGDTWRRLANYMEVIESTNNYDDTASDTEGSAENVVVSDAHSLDEIAAFTAVTTS